MYLRAFWRGGAVFWVRTTASTLTHPYTGTHDAGMCRFVFRAKATQPEESVSYTYQLRAMVLIAPTTWAPQVPLEDGLGSFRDSFRLTWDASLGTQPEIRRFLRFHLTAGLFQLDKGITVMCPT